MVQIFGEFIDDLPPGHDYLDIGFSANSRPIQQRWRTNRLSAHFVAEYLSTFIPVSDDDPDRNRQKEQCRGAVSYIANELLENAMKFSIQEEDFPVRFGLHFIENPTMKIVLFTTNAIAPQAQDKFYTFIKELLQSDPNDLYIRQLERSAEAEQDENSGLGFLTMINDYCAQIGWKFQPLPSSQNLVEVTTLVQILL